MSRFGKLLVAFDGSPDSHKAVDFALEIARYAEEHGCDLVVVGRRGRSKSEEWFLGSV